MCVCVWKWLNVVTRTNDTWQPTIEIMFDNRNRYTDTISHCLILLPACLAIVTASQPASPNKRTHRQTSRQSKAQNNFNHHSFVRHKLSMAIDMFFCFCFYSCCCCCCCCIFFNAMKSLFLFRFFLSHQSVWFSGFCFFFIIFVCACLAIVFVRQQLDIFYFCHLNTPHTHTHTNIWLHALTNFTHIRRFQTQVNKQKKKRGLGYVSVQKNKNFSFHTHTHAHTAGVVVVVDSFVFYMPDTRNGVSKPKHACSAELFLVVAAVAAHKHSFVIFLLFVKKNKWLTGWRPESFTRWQLQNTIKTPLWLAYTC